jgi:beta-mannosidase
MAVQGLSQNWQFKQADTEEWLPVARVPTNVHLDLIDNKKYNAFRTEYSAFMLTQANRIEDPFQDFNELKCEWIHDEDWIYRTTLPPKDFPHGVKAVLAFDGLDTYATVKFNGDVVLESDNMWIMHRVDVTDQIQHDEENVLEIYFKTALPESQRIKAAHPEHKWLGSNGDMARLAVRKAQYHCE